MSAITLDDLVSQVPKGWRFHVGHTPHWYRSDQIPKHLRKRPFEAYVINDQAIGNKLWVMTDADGATPFEALYTALTQALSLDIKKRTDAQINGQ